MLAFAGELRKDEIIAFAVTAAILRQTQGGCEVGLCPITQEEFHRYPECPADWGTNALLNLMTPEMVQGATQVFSNACLMLNRVVAGENGTFSLAAGAGLLDTQRQSCGDSMVSRSAQRARFWVCTLALGGSGKEMMKGDLQQQVGPRGFLFTPNLKQQDNRDYDKHDRDKEDPRYRRDKSVSAIRTNTYVQTNVLFASWARLHYGQCIPSVLWVSTIRCITFANLKSIE